MASPESQGLDAKILARAVSAAAENMAGLKSLLVIRHGYIVSETYFQGTSAETTYQLYSVTKSFTGTLVGIAADQGLIDIQRKVLSFFPGRTFANMNLAKQAMAVAHLLTMTSGMAWIEGDATYIEMYQSSDWVRYVLDRPMGAEPGTEFVYNSGVSHVLSAIVNEAVKGQKLDTLSFAQKYLFRPLGINEQWDKDSQGIPIGGWGLRLTPRDMAKLGYLYLREGAWEGKQIVSSEWVRAATQRQAPLSLNDLGYGYQWWVYPLKGQYAQYVAYTALGRFGQTVFVVPALDLIVVTTAQLDGHNLIFRLIDEFIVPAMK